MRVRGSQRRRLRSFLADDRGQATTEYILILLVAITAGSTLARLVMNTLDSGVSNLGAQLEQDLKTGRAPLSVWKK